MDPQARHLGEDDRFQVEMLAQATERRNRSVGLFILALVILAGCTLFWVWGWRAKSDAIRRLRAEQRDNVTIEAKLLHLDALRSQSSGSDLQGEPITDMGTRLRNIADQVGLADLPVPDETQSKAAGGSIKTYVYDDIINKSLDSILEWMARAEQDIPGLEVFSLQITPEEAQQQWSVNVTFRRWERAQ